MKTDINALIAQVVGIINQIISIGVVLLIFAAVLQKYGVRIPQLPQISATELAWLCGAIWLARGGRIA